MTGKFIRVIALVTVIGIAIPLCTVLFAALLFDFDRDPFDRFEVIRITSESGPNRHAITYRYDHANSSNRVIGTWIVSGSPPAIGSTEPARGAPVLIWTGTPEEIGQKWVQGRLAVFTEDRSEVRKDKFSDCYFENEGKRMLCFDSKIVDFVDSR